MKIEDKQLLIQDMSSRLPYGVICKDTSINVTGTLSQIGLHYDVCTLDKDNGDSEVCYLLKCKPYLFPLESMTMEQAQQWHKYANDRGGLAPSTDWLNAHHFDYRGLIPRGLAINATGLNIYDDILFEF